MLALTKIKATLALTDMDVDAQCELIRQFMIAVAPHVTAHCLANELTVSDAAGLSLEAGMQLAARYNQLCETLAAPPQDALEKSKLQTSPTTEGVHKASARIPVAKPDVPNLPRAEERRHTSPLSPNWRPPKPD